MMSRMSVWCNRFILFSAAAIAACDDPTGITPLRLQLDESSFNNVTVTNSATGVSGTTITYDWSISKSVAPTSSNLAPGASVTLNYTIQASRSGTTTNGSPAVKGQVCIDNQNDNAITVDSIQEILEVKRFGSAVWENADVEGNTHVSPVPLGGVTSIAAHTQTCYTYLVPFTPQAGSQYRTWGTAFTSVTQFPFNVKTIENPNEFTIPGSPNEVDPVASVFDAVTCPTGFTCGSPVGATFPMTVTDNTTINYTVDVTNTSAACSSSASVNNTSTITESSTGDLHTAGATSTINTGACVPLCTATQGGWGQKASGNNIGSMRDRYFLTVYPVGYVIVGTTTRYIKLTSAAAVDAYLPANAGIGQLDKTYTNPTSTPAKVFGGQVTSLKLNVDFSNANVGVWTPGLATTVITAPGPFQGRTVQELLDTAMSVLAGGALPTGMSLGDMNNLVSAINGMTTPDGCSKGDASLIQQRYK